MCPQKLTPYTRPVNISWLNRYRKVPKFSDARKLCCNQPKIQTKGPNLRLLHQNDANGIANSEDTDQTAPLCNYMYCDFDNCHNDNLQITK